MADQLLFRALRDRLGFTNLTSAATGGAALGPDTFRFFLAMGVPLRQLYGQTELLGAYTVHRPEDVNFDTRRGALRRDHRDASSTSPTRTASARSSRATPTCSAAISAWTEVADLRDGWLHTGDAGYFDKAGHLVVIDRIKDIADHQPWRPVQPAIHREQAEVQPLCRRGRGAGGLAARISRR